MKKGILILIAIITLLSGSSFAQVKVNFTLQNARIENNNLVIDLYGTVPSGQTWAVGPTNVRIDYYTVPANGIALMEQNPVPNANSNISNNTNYDNMTSTSIISGTAVSANILLLYGKTAYSLGAGNYWLGSLTFSRSNPSACAYMNFRTSSVIYNDNTLLTYGSGWTKTDPNPCVISSTHEIKTEIPSEYKLSQNYPNPFNPTTKINFAVPKEGYVTLKVYDLLGREVADLVNEVKSPGTYIIDFEASYLASGIYYYRFEAEEFVSVKKMILMK